MEECSLGMKIFQFNIEIDRSEMTKSCMLHTSLKLTNHKCLMEK